MIYVNNDMNLFIFITWLEDHDTLVSQHLCKNRPKTIFHFPWIYVTCEKVY